MPLGDRIRNRRRELGWTQEELCRRAGIKSKGFLSDVENGKRGISAETLLDIARVLDVSLDYLMTGRDEDARGGEIEIPESLAVFASEAGISFRQALMLLDMRRQILAHRSTSKTHDLDAFDWRRFFESVRDFL